MKNFYFLFLLISSLSFFQSSDFSEIWVNNKDFFVGKINGSDFQIKIENSEEIQRTIRNLLFRDLTWWMVPISQISRVK